MKYILFGDGDFSQEFICRTFFSPVKSVRIDFFLVFAHPTSSQISNGPSAYHPENDFSQSQARLLVIFHEMATVS